MDAGRGGAGAYPSATEIERARAVLRRGWAERATELGRPEPVDLSGACKFAALFAVSIFGGTLRANHAHAWAELGGDVVDLVAPSDATAAGRYTPDPEFERRREFAESLDSCRPRVGCWVSESRRGQTGSDARGSIGVSR
jgi:hypothetical protein